MLGKIRISPQHGTFSLWQPLNAWDQAWTKAGYQELFRDASSAHTAVGRTCHLLSLYTRPNDTWKIKVGGTHGSQTHDSIRLQDASKAAARRFQAASKSLPRRSRGVLHTRFLLLGFTLARSARSPASSPAACRAALAATRRRAAATHGAPRGSTRGEPSSTASPRRRRGPPPTAWTRRGAGRGEVY